MHDGRELNDRCWHWQNNCTPNIEMPDPEPFSRIFPGPVTDPAAWRRAIGERQISARLETLPDRKVPRRLLMLSGSGHVFLLVLLLVLPFFFTDELGKINYQVMPIAEVRTEAPIRLRIQRRPVRAAVTAT